MRAQDESEQSKSGCAIVHRKGQQPVILSPRPPRGAACLVSCFPCSVGWPKESKYCWLGDHYFRLIRNEQERVLRAWPTAKRWKLIQSQFAWDSLGSGTKNPIFRKGPVPGKPRWLSHSEVQVRFRSPGVKGQLLLLRWKQRASLQKVKNWIH